MIYVSMVLWAACVPMCIAVFWLDAKLHEDPDSDAPPPVG